MKKTLIKGISVILAAVIMLSGTQMIFASEQEIDQTEAESLPTLNDLVNNQVKVPKQKNEEIVFSLSLTQEQYQQIAKAMVYLLRPGTPEMDKNFYIEDTWCLYAFLGGASLDEDRNLIVPWSGMLACTSGTPFLQNQTASGTIISIRPFVIEDDWEYGPNLDVILNYNPELNEVEDISVESDDIDAQDIGMYDYMGFLYLWRKTTYDDTGKLKDFLEWDTCGLITGEESLPVPLNIELLPVSDFDYLQYAFLIENTDGTRWMTEPQPVSSLY